MEPPPPSEPLPLPNHSAAPDSDSQSSHSRDSVLNPAPFDAQLLPTDDRIHAEFQKLDLKEEATAAAKDFVEGGEWEVEKNPDEDEEIEENDNEEADAGDGDGDGDGGEVEKKWEMGARNNWYPVRPDAEDCSFYLKTGTCKFGSFCKFNHPVRNRNQAVSEKLKYDDDSLGQANKGECKDEKECPYYMRTGSCKYGANCRFHHPDPTTVTIPESPSGYNNGVPLQSASQSPIASWTSPRVLNETTTFVPAMISPSQDSEWNAYQAPIYPSEISLLPPPTYVMNHRASEPDLYTSHQQVVEYPERPGQPECNYFLKTGDCKFKSLCKYHHPKNRNPKLPICTLSDKGLPLRPDQNICTYYSRYSICKFGPSCKFDHPILPGSPTVSAHEQQQPHFGNFTVTEEAEIAGEGSGNSATVEQSA